jgi:hypothetical protein
MRKPSITIMLTILTAISFGQISTTKVTPKVDNIEIIPYDSTKNFLGTDVFQYVGQYLYLNEAAEGLRKYGYRGFTIDLVHVEDILCITAVKD